MSFFILPGRNGKEIQLHSRIVMNLNRLGERKLFNQLSLFNQKSSVTVSFYMLKIIQTSSNPSKSTSNITLA